MDKYTVTRTFVDLQDGRHRYAVGDVYPRSGYVPTLERLMELLGSNNKLGVAVIEAVTESALPLPEEASEDTNTDENKVDKPKTKRRAKKA